MTKAVMGCLPSMPEGFPMTFPENAGNMIHGRAPFEMFDDSVFYKDSSFRLSGYTNFAQFANNNCTHLIVTIANLIRINDDDGTKYSNFQRFLESIELPIVIFGLGAQANTQDLEGTTVPQEAVDLMQYLGQRCDVVGVRGPFTKKVFSHFAGVENVHVTGCPSFFQRPHKFKDLQQSLKAGKIGRAAYNGTVMHKADETKMLVDAIAHDAFLVEPVNKFNHKFHLDCSAGIEDPEIPWYLRNHVGDGKPLSHDQLKRFYRSNYRLFRNADDWYAFNEACVSYSYGTRFHVNMASILSGVPAIWVTHDSRTQELTDFLHLPSISLEKATSMSAPEYEALLFMYDDLFDNLHQLYDNFNSYLSAYSLPQLKLEI